VSEQQQGPQQAVECPRCGEPYTYGYNYELMGMQPLVHRCEGISVTTLRRIVREEIERALRANDPNANQPYNSNIGSNLDEICAIVAGVSGRQK